MKLIAMSDPATWELARDVLSVPLVAATALVIATYVFPPVRWRRQAKQAIELSQGLIDGPEKDYWSARAAVLASRVRLYWKNTSAFVWVLSWLSVVLVPLVVLTTVVSGPSLVEELGGAVLLLALAGIVGNLALAWQALKGSDSSDGPPRAEYPNTRAGQKIKYEETKQSYARFRARSRLRDLRRAARDGESDTEADGPQPVGEQA